MDARQQLLRLVRIQDLAARVRSSQDVVDGAPQLIEEIEQRFRERNAAYVAVQERFEALEADQRHRNGELQLLEDQRRKYMDDLMQVSNQREYSAILREIDTVKGRIAEHEDAVLKNMDELEKLTGELATHEAHIIEERKHVAEERAAVESESAEAQQAIDAHQRERGKIEAELPVSLIEAVRRLEVGRQGVFLSRAEDGVCRCCFVRVRPQVYQEIRLAAALHTCASCRRILVHEPTLYTPLAAPAEANAGDVGAGVETANGGAV